jgi:hypothetical protein
LLAEGEVGLLNHHISGAETLGLGPGRKRRSFC